MLKYIELKTGYADNGPAWIARVGLSKSGRSVYFNGRTLQRGPGSDSRGNHHDAETGEGYWISGVKRDGKDRHWAGAGIVQIEAEAVEEYLHITGRNQLDRRFQVGEPERADSKKSS
jgi:hypothetical protein